MTVDRSFRRGLAVTLALGVLCLGYAEWDYLPEVTYFSFAVAGLIAVAYWLDRSGRNLSLNQANLLGAGIILAAAAWLMSHYVDPSSLMNTLPWPAGGLPFLAPLLMLLIPAKMFRPKEAADWWALYGVSLACVVLAIALAEDGGFVFVALAYAVSAVWSLCLFHFFREGRRQAAAPRRQFRFALGAFALAFAIALPMFFLTPRTSGVSWELFNHKLESGVTSGFEPDMARTGKLELSKEIAFEFTATRTPTGGPIDDLPKDMRFRVTAFNIYETPRGRWQRGEGFPIVDSPDARFWDATLTRDWPDLGPSSFFLDFSPGGRIVAFADPVAWKPNQPSPISTAWRGRYFHARQLWDASFGFTIGEFRYARGYQQITVPEDDRNPANTFTLTGDPQLLLAPFRGEPPAKITELARQLVDEWRREGRVPSARLANGDVPPSAYDAVAEQFRIYLAVNEQFRYSLDLRRQDKAVDPMIDFLLNVRRGHCQRFASAHVLLCRGVGIPSQLAIGYMGLEPIGEGRYRVRQGDAHAWSEVLVPAGGTLWRWKAFDTTPLNNGDDANAASLFAARTRAGQKFVADLMIKLNQDTQKQITEDFSGFLKGNWSWLVPAVSSILVLLAFLRFRKVFRSTPPVADPCPMLSEWSATFAGIGQARQPAETVREYETRSLAILESKNLAEFITLPQDLRRWIEDRHYAQKPDAAGEAELQDRLRSLKAALANA